MSLLLELEQISLKLWAFFTLPVQYTPGLMQKNRMISSWSCAISSVQPYVWLQYVMGQNSKCGFRMLSLFVEYF